MQGARYAFFSQICSPLIRNALRCVCAVPQRASGSVAPFQSSMQEIEELQD